MSEARIRLKRGEFEFEVDGEAAWVREQFREALEMFSTEKLAVSTEGDNVAPKAASGVVGAAKPSSAVERWLAANQFTRSGLESLFHIDGTSVSVIADEIPGATGAKRARYCYLLEGIRAFLETGEPRFIDEAARDVCRRLGCYDQGNHAKSVLANLRNWVTTTGDALTLTAPGLKAAAELIKGMTPSSS